MDTLKKNAAGKRKHMFSRAPFLLKGFMIIFSTGCFFEAFYLVVGPNPSQVSYVKHVCFCCQVLERISTKEKLNQAQFKLKLPVLFFKLGLAVYVAFVMYICVSLHRIAYDKGDENCVLCASQSHLVSLCSSIAVLGIRFFTKAFPN